MANRGKNRNVRNKLNKDNFKGKTYSPKPKEGSTKKFCDDQITDIHNAPQWYFKDERLLADVASFSFNHPLGTRLHFNNYHVPTTTIQNYNGLSTIPGVMSIRLGLTPGIATDAQSPVNLAATNIYSFVRYKNSGASNYDAPDLMMYLLAMDSIYACWNWLQRIYGMASIYSQRNKYLPYAYMAANNVDLDDVLSNLADFRAWLNIKANEVSAFCVPATMTYNVRHSWLFSNVFKDSDTSKAQQYMYTPAWFYKYDETGSSAGGRLVPITAVPDLSTNPTKYKVSDLEKMLNGMLEAVNYSEDIGIMSGDILKAYGDSGLFKLSSVDPDYKVEAAHSSEVLWQIENMQPLYLGTTEMSQFDIVQDPNTNFIKFNPTLSNVDAPRNGGYLNFHHQSVDPKDVIVATRLKPSTVINKEGTGTTIVSVGSEVALNGYIHVFMTSYASNIYNVLLEDQATLTLQNIEIPFTKFVQLNKTEADASAAINYLGLIGQYTAFDWAPELLLGVSYNGKEYTTGVIRDWDNYTQLDNQDIEAMNLLALLSEFNIPN